MRREPRSRDFDPGRGSYSVQRARVGRTPPTAAAMLVSPNIQPSRSLSARFLPALLLAAVLPLLSGCTAVGLGLGKEIDERFHEVGLPDSLTHADIGRSVWIVTTEGEEISGHLKALVPSERGTGLFVQRVESASLFHTVMAFEDTIPAATICTLELGGRPGNAASIGVMTGFVADILLTQLLIHQVFGPLRSQ